MTWFCYCRLYLLSRYRDWSDFHLSLQQWTFGLSANSVLEPCAALNWKLKATSKPHLCVAACQLAQGVCMCVYLCVCVQWVTQTGWQPVMLLQNFGWSLVEKSACSVTPQKQPTVTPWPRLSSNGLDPLKAQHKHNQLIQQDVLWPSISTQI